jgi:CHAT domain-containing protein
MPTASPAIEERAVSVAPSASVYARLAARERAGAGVVFALGNPDLGSPRLALPAAEREVQGLKALYTEAEVYVRAEAAKERMLTRSPHSRLVHVAADAEVDEIDPLYSVIRHAQAGKASGNLEAHEVYRLDLAGAALVAPSACETGLGKVSRGDEMWGFTRSFLAAGAPALLVSPWAVDDESTARLMGRFHTEVKGGAEARAARRAAQLDVARAGCTAHPFFCAGFILVGDGR